MANMNEKNFAEKRKRPEGNDGGGFPPFASPEMTEAGIWIENDKYAPEHSIPEVVRGEGSGLVYDAIKINSDINCLNGFVVKGGSREVTLQNASMELSGWGCSDFTSKGTGAMVYEGGALTLKNVDIVTRGATRAATIATKGGTLKVYDSKLATYGGPLPPGYVPVIGPGMMEPPYPLGLGGNCRTHLSMDNSETFFYNCDIFADAWAAVSTDASGGYVYCEVNNSRLTIANNGYGTYADNGCHVCFNDSVIKTGNMAVIQDGNSSVTFNNTDCTCGKIGVLTHGGMEDYKDIGLIEMNGGSFVCEEQVLLCKSTNVDIYVKGAKLSSKLGIILENKLTDDRMYFTRRTAGPQCYGVQATFEAVDIEGDFLFGDPERKQCLNLVNARLQGAVAGNPKLALYEGSTWTAKADSFVTFTGAVDISAIDAQERVTIRAFAENGCELTGEYMLPSGGKLIIVSA